MTPLARMRTKKVCRLLLCPLLCTALYACSGTQTPTTTIQTRGARASIDAVFLVTGEAAPMHAPSAPFGVFVSMYLSSRGAIPVNAALQGIDAQTKIAKKNIPLDETYSLLETLGTVLQVDIPDMLNRSEDRADTLNQYATALANVTERGKQKATEIQNELDSLKAKEREQNSRVSTIQRAISTALLAKDYAAAGENQKALSEAQAGETPTPNPLPQTRQ